jgi:hypothetical protein
MDKVDKHKVKALLAKLDSGINVSVRDLQNTLGIAAVEEYKDRWQAELDRREMFTNKPDAIKEYENILKKADFANNRADGIKHIGVRSKVVNGVNSKARLRNSAEALYQVALTKVEEMLHADRSLEIWFDRQLDFGFESKLSIDVVGIPRVVTSRSEYKHISGITAQLTKEDIKHELLERALYEGNTLELTEKQKHLLTRRLASINSEKD